MTQCKRCRENIPDGLSYCAVCQEIIRLNSTAPTVKEKYKKLRKEEW